MGSVQTGKAKSEPGKAGKEDICFPALYANFQDFRYDPILRWDESKNF